MTTTTTPATIATTCPLCGEEKPPRLLWCIPCCVTQTPESIAEFERARDELGAWCKQVKPLVQALEGTPMHAVYLAQYERRHGTWNQLKAMFPEAA